MVKGIFAPIHALVLENPPPSTYIPRTPSKWST